MSDAKRVSAQEARTAVQEKKALLVCAYGSEEKFQSYQLEGAISFSAFEAQVDGLSKDTALIFYCA